MPEMMRRYNYDSCTHASRSGIGLNYLLFFLKPPMAKRRKSGFPAVLNCRTSSQYLDGCFFKLFKEKRPSHKWYFARLGMQKDLLNSFRTARLPVERAFGCFWREVLIEEKSANLIFHSHWSGNRSVLRWIFLPF